ncbi:MAG: 30S ribosome-binding factor RbfA [Anaerovoracaceae bacterium]|jgi:ribosome-binding factor A
MPKGYRQGRLGVEIQKLISDMLRRDLKDPRLKGMISITDVDVTGDNSYATCYVTVLGNTTDETKQHEKEQEVIRGLESASGRIRGEIGRRMKLRHAPELIFKVDHSMEYGRHIDELLKGLEENEGK